MLLLPLIAAAAFAQSTATLSGTITDAVTRLPLHRALISAPNGSRDVTGPDGRFTLPELPAGEVKLNLVARGYRTLDTTVKMANDERRGAYFELQPMARISGRLTDKVSGKPLVRMLHLTAADGRQVDFSPTGADGAFQFVGLESGDYKLQVNPVDEVEISFNPRDDAKRPDSYGAASETIHLTEGEQKLIDMPLVKVEPRSISGTIEFPPGFEAAPLSVGYTNVESTLALMKNTGTHGSGAFRLDGLTLPGDYRVLARAGAGSRKLFAFATAGISDHDVDGVTLKLLPGADISGSIVVAEEGATFPLKVPALAAFLLPADKAALGLNDAWPVQSGRFQAEGVARGNYWPQIMNLPADYAITKILLGNVDTAGRPISFYGPAELTFVVTSKPGSIAGTVRNRNQERVKDAKISLIPQFTGDPQRIMNTVSGPSGEFALRNLAPGKYTIEGAEPIEVKPGQTTAVTVTR